MAVRIVELLVLLAMPTLSLPGSEAANILIYPFGHCLNSHLLNMEKLADILISEGHHASMIISDRYSSFLHSPEMGDPQVTPLLFDAPKDFTPVCEYDSVTWMLHAPLSQRFVLFMETNRLYCENLISNQTLMSFLKAANFDVFLVESMDPCGRILADYLDIPFIILHTTGLGHYDGNFRPPSYVPAAIAPFQPNMNLLQRMGNTFMKLMYDSMPVLVGFWEPFEELKKSYNLNTSLSIENTFNRASLKLASTNFGVDYPTPVEPNTILVGGFAMDTPKELDQDLEDFMQSSGENGVIIFSLGTLTKSYDAYWTDLFTSAFAKLPQKVIWRNSGAENLPSPLSDNIRVVKWIPQVSLLAHNQTRLFITHCGMNGAYETAYYGVPILGLPMSGDHFHHCTKLADYHGMGRQLDMYSITSQSLFEAIKGVLEDPTYAKNAKTVSNRLQDQPMSSQDKIKYWVNYIIRHKEAPHLQSLAHTLTWYQYFCVDVIICFLLIALILLGTVVTVTIYAIKKLSKMVHLLMEKPKKM